MEKGISYKLKTSGRARRMRLTVYCDGSVVVTSPLGTPRSTIERFIADKKRWVGDKIRLFRGVDGGARRVFSRRDYLENRDRALALARERVDLYNKTYGFSVNKISIKNQKTRWGSCSRKQNINLNYKIVFLPQRHQDYIIVHEMCHLGEFNHSKKFWALVERAVPDHREIRKELRRREFL